MHLLTDNSLESEDNRVFASPFAFLVAENQLSEAQYAALEDDFPKYHGAGFFPYDPADCGEHVQQLVAELTAPAFADRIGQHLGVPDLGRYPALVTLCRSLNKRHGTIHTDSRSKVVTALLYLNRDWPPISEGCLRFLDRIDDVDALVAPEKSCARPNAGASRGWSSAWPVFLIDALVPAATAARHIAIDAPPSRDTAQAITQPLRSAAMRSASGGWLMNRRLRPLPTPPEMPNARTSLGRVLTP